MIGIVSYLLIGYFYTRIQATKSALLALTMNRLGDMGLSIGFFALFALFGSIDYSTVFSLAPYFNENAITIISLLLFSGAVAKSAQLPLMTWLPYSMEAKAILIKIFIIIIEIYFISQDVIPYISDSKFFIEEEIILLVIPVIHTNRLRDSKGRFRSPTIEEILPLPELNIEIKNPLIGNLLGDGYLRLTNKNGKPISNQNAYYSMTLKNKSYIYHLWKNIYSNICTKTEPRPWPNPKTGKPIIQYAFSTKSLPSLTLLHSQWYKWSELNKTYIKIVPLNIKEILTPIGLAHWIMDDGYSHGKGLILATESFTLDEVNMLKEVLINKFDLIVTIQIRKSRGINIGYRLRISSKSRDKLLLIVKPYFIPSMNYKLNI